MKDHTFNTVAMHYANRQIGRRQVLWRALAASLGATGLVHATGGLSGARLRVPSAQSPFDPPPPNDWPDHLPWPPWGPFTGPIFSIAVPRGTAEATGIHWYIGGFDPAKDSGLIVGLTRSGEEIRRYTFLPSGRSGVEFSLWSESTRFDGQMTLAIEKESRIRVRGNLDGSRFDATGTRDGDLKVTTAATLEPAKVALLAEYQLIAEDVVRIGDTLQGTPSLPHASCGGCAVSAAGLSLWGGGCAATLSVVCFGGFLTAAGIFVDKCTGACA